MIPPALLDTDILSHLMRQDRSARAHGLAYLAEHGQFTFSLVTRYEILRGLKVKQAAVQLAAFEQFCNVNNVLPMTDAIVVRAAEIYADLRRRGALIGDADILIAATAQDHSLVLVTNNTKHFSNITGLQILSWAAP